MCRRGRGGGGPEEPEDRAPGRPRGGSSAKVHLLCDGHGRPLGFHLTPGQAHEATAFVDLPIGADERVAGGGGGPVAWPVALAGDEGYRAGGIDEYRPGPGVKPVTPSKEDEDRSARPAELDEGAYRRRGIVEDLIGWSKECRRVSSRLEKAAKNCGGMIRMAFIERYLRLTCQ